MIKKLFATIFVGCCLGSYNSQAMTLDEAIRLAHKQSLSSFRAENMYLESYWDYHTFMALKRPWLNLNVTPVDFNRSVVQRYDSENNIDVYRPQQTLTNAGEISINQEIFATGGSIYIATSLDRLQNFGDEKYINWNANLFTIGLRQPLNGYNHYKWDKKIAPMEYAIAKKQLILDMENLNEVVVNNYFNYLLAKIKLENQRRNLKDKQTLLEINKKQFKIGTLNKEQYSNMEYQLLTTQTAVTDAEKDLSQKILQLNSTLNRTGDESIDVMIPQLPILAKVDAQEVLGWCMKNNIELLQQSETTLKAEQDADKSRKEARFQDINLNAQYGLNQQGETVGDAYHNPKSSENVSLSLSIPIVDWGNARGKRQKASKSLEVARIEEQQKQNDVKQELIELVINFNAQRTLIENKKAAKEKAEETYELTKESFATGLKDMTTLQQATENKDNAIIDYIQSMQTFWSYYYKLRQKTLYDFEKVAPLTEDYDRIIEEDY